MGLGLSDGLHQRSNAVLVILDEIVVGGREVAFATAAEGAKIRDESALVRGV